MMNVRSSSVVALGGAALIFAASALGAAPAGATGTLCVGGPGCYRNLQGAVDAARDGSTIRIWPGIYAGGVRIDKSLRLMGAGIGRTVIKGGGPVLTVESRNSDQSVLISGLSITGGLTRQWDGRDWQAYGGGILVTAATEQEIGALVTLDHVAVVGNRTAPTTTYPSPSGVTCPDGYCPFAGSYGAGIANFGNLVVHDSVIRDNRAVGHVSDAAGGGIYSANGDVRIESSDISGNSAVPAPHGIGRYAEGGGVFAHTGSFTLRSSRVIGNTADLITDWPTLDSGEVITMNALGGGLQLDGAQDVLIEDSDISDNVTRAENQSSEVGAWGAVMTGQGSTAIRRSTIRGNTVAVTAASTDTVGPAGPTVQIVHSAEVSDTRITANSIRVQSRTGSAGSFGVLGNFSFGEGEKVTLTRVVVSGNTVAARSNSGPASVLGAGITNLNQMELRDSRVSGNVGRANGATATSQGGGIWNGTVFPGDPLPQLSVINSMVTANAVTTSPTGGAAGGGIYTELPVAPVHSLVFGNRPDDCAGCTAGTTTVKESHIERPGLLGMVALPRTPLANRVPNAVP